MINHKSALRTRRLRRDAWASLPGLHDNAPRSELNYPGEPALLLLSPAVLPFCTLPNPPILHSMEQHCFLLPLLHTPRTATSKKMLQLLLCSTLDRGVHCMSGWKFITPLRSDATHPHRRVCEHTDHFPPRPDWKGCQCLWHRPHSSLGYRCYACACSFSPGKVEVTKLPLWRMLSAGLKDCAIYYIQSRIDITATTFNIYHAAPLNILKVVRLTSCPFGSQLFPLIVAMV